MMKKILIYGILGIGCLLSCNPSNTQKQADEADHPQMDSVYSRDGTALESAHNPMNVEEIQRTYADVRALIDQGKLDTSSFTYNCHGEREGTVTYYMQEDRLLLVEHTFNEYSHYEATEEYYVKNDSLYFAFLKSLTWNFESGSTPEATKDDIIESRVYLVNDQPIHCLQKNYIVRSDAADNPTSEETENIEIDCPAPDAVLTSFRTLFKYNGVPTAGCLE